MIHYMDMTFCPFWKECAKGEQCERAITDEVRKAAKKWWHGDDYPMALYSQAPACYAEKEEC